MGTARVIGRIVFCANPLVPVISVTIERPNTMTIHANVVATQNKCCRLVLVAIREGCLQPILDIGAPLQSESASYPLERNERSGMAN